MHSKLIHKIKTSLRGWSIYFYAVLGALSILYVSNTPYFNLLNNLLLDKLHGQIEPRTDIVLINIDDQALNEIGAWPWNRKIFATAITNLNKVNAGAVGIDVLFLEEREGDDDLRNAIENSSIPIILGNKIVAQELVTTTFSSSNVKEGYVNFTSDTDGIIRRVHFTRQLPGGCVASFGYQVLRSYYFDKNPVSCKQTIQLQKLYANNIAKFNYTNANFIEYSFHDLYTGNLTESMIKDRIVLIGIKTKDIKSEISDNFKDPFGNTIAGIELHANVLNTFLDQKFQVDLDLNTLMLGYIIIAMLVTFIGFHVLKKSTSRLIFYLAIFFTNIVLGVLYYELGLNWPFVGTSMLLVLLYGLMIVYDAISQKTENLIIRKAFKYYVNPELLRQLMADPASLNLGGEERYMTVLFSDIRGFTSISEQLEPKRLYYLLNQYLEAMSAIILGKAGTIDKYIGDGIMAFWNAPVTVQFHQQKAVEAALDMVDTLREFNSNVLKNEVALNIGIGIHTGSMLVGNIGGSARFDYTVLGDSVNVASRIEGLTKLYNIPILVSKDVVESLPKPWEGVIFRILDRVSVVGRSETLAIYQPLRETPENIDLKNRYEKAITLYFEGKFEEALVIFGQLSQDPAALLLANRIEALGEPTEDWDGVWVWKEKK